MLVPVQWLREYVDFELTPEALAERLTMAGLEVEEIRQIGGEIVFSTYVTPNRPDLLSILGVARHISALLDSPLKPPRFELSEGGTDASALVEVDIQSPINCPRYSARVLTGVKVTHSPKWMQDRLAACGMRPINNVVDATNYVLLELGQPLHAFDYDLVADHRIIVRQAGVGEKISTLDGEERKLDPSVLVIADSKHAVAVAGVMGGLDSEVTYSTKNILLESAHFNRLSIRRTSRSLQLSTEASYRFERGVDPNLTVFALDRAAQLIQETGGGEIARGVVDAYPTPVKPLTVTIRPERASMLLGFQVTGDEIADYLTRLGMEVVSGQSSVVSGGGVPGQVGGTEGSCDECGRMPSPLPSPLAVNDEAKAGEGESGAGDLAAEGGCGRSLTLPSLHGGSALPLGNTLGRAGDGESGYTGVGELVVTVPTFRPDISLEEDLIEEVGIVYGYENIPEKLPCGESMQGRDSELGRFRSRVSDALIAAGLQEVATNTMVASTDDCRQVRVRNPLSDELSCLRGNLLLDLLGVVSYNGGRGTKDLGVFEIGRVFQTEDDSLLIEKLSIAAVLTGSIWADAWNVDKAAAQIDFFFVKGIIERLLDRLGLCDVSYSPADACGFHPTRTAVIESGGRRLGFVGQISARAAAQYDVSEDAYAFELDFSELMELAGQGRAYRSISRYPALTRDIALIVRDEASYQSVKEIIAREGGELLESIVLFDVYTGDPVPKGRKNLAFTLTFRSRERTLRDEEVDESLNRVKSVLATELGASFRSE